ncbi:DUF1566 domain-containing protein [Leucothrix arctica]|uniref:PKD domain-containing protein n=1 Tax=Leucothrix arctica TaxID=1481894 RepID=A0A317CDB1_9GAMM|nr:DUF1566 domain-containing protein [Leucothrix arctica]PWQ94300.1 hypothetical protein DKT75_16195 [Leucothrix arctica]
MSLPFRTALTLRSCLTLFFVYLLSLIIFLIPAVSNADWPQAIQDNVSVVGNQSLVVSVLDNDVGEGLELISVNEGTTQGGSASINDDNQSITYQAAAGFTGTDSFWYNFRDTQGRENATQVLVEVASDGPVKPVEWPDAQSDSSETTLDQAIDIEVLSNDVGVNLKIILVNTSTVNGGVASISTDEQRIRYIPPTGFIGTDEFWYNFEDHWGRVNAAKVTVEVTSEELVKPIEWPAANEDLIDAVIDTTTIVSVLENDIGSGLILTSVNTSTVKNGSASLSEDKLKIVYIPPQSYIGDDEFWYVFSDSWGRTNAAKVVITVKPDYSAWPSAVADYVETNKNNSLLIPVLDNDVGEELQLVTVNTFTTGSGQAKIEEAGISYTPAIDFIGTDSFWYSFEDAQGRKNSTQVFVTVLDVTDTDEDGISNSVDTDDDNDGVPDIADAFPLNADETIDTDNDGIGNNADTDDDQDGVLDTADAFPLDETESVDTDNDGMGNNADNDDDGDGFLDQVELTAGTDPLNPSSRPVSNEPIRSSIIPQTGETTVFQEFDDGSIRAGVERSYTRNDNSETVLDNITGLIWQDNEDVKELELSWDDASSYCQNLTLANISDWRLPEKYELLYLVDHSRDARDARDQLLDDEFMNMYRDDGYSTPAYYHWTNDVSTYSGTRYALEVGFLTGVLVQTRVATTNHTRCVSGNTTYAPNIRHFSDDLAVDVNSKLMWQDDITVVDNKVSWSDAITYCENLELGGVNDWRLPNVNEGHSIIGGSAYSLFSNRHSYTNFSNKPYWWTSNEHRSRSGEALVFYSVTGSYKQFYDYKIRTNYVRCVRDYKEPVIIWEGDSTITQGESITLDGSASYDQDGTIVSYRWFNRTLFETISTEQTATVNNLPAGEHEIYFEVTDNHGLSNATVFILTVLTDQRLNTSPIADVGSDQTVFIGNAITFNAGNSSDSDGSITSYEWKEGGTVLSNSISFTKNDLSVGTHEIYLTVTDNEGATSTDSLTVTVVPILNEPPVADAGSDQVIIYGTSVTLDASNSLDPDGSIVSYEWKDGGALLSSDVSFTTDELSEGLHEIQLTVTDNNGATNTDSINITVNTQPIEYELQVCPVNQVIDDSAFVDRYPDENIAWIGANYSDVLEIKKAFNNARLVDNSVFQYLEMPSQAVWDGMSLQEKGLYLINSERTARGLKPYEGVSQNIVDVATQYSDYIRENNQVIGHYNDGNSPVQRLRQDSAIEANGSFQGWENVYSVYGASGLPVATEEVVRAIYYWTYIDKYPLSGPSWGHRSLILQKGLDDDSGSFGQEGLIGLGVSIGAYDPSNLNPSYTGAVVTLNLFDPLSGWDHSGTITVNVDGAQLCNDYAALEIDESQVSLDGLVSLEIASADIYLTPNSSEQVQVMAVLEDGSRLDVSHVAELTPDFRSVISIEAGNIVALRYGSVYVSAKVNNVVSNRVLVVVKDKGDTTNLTGTYAESYQDYIPSNASISHYDPKAFSLLTGFVKDRNGLPLSDVNMSVLNAPEYGSIKTDDDGKFVLTVEAGSRQLVYQKSGYLTVHRKQNAASNNWAVLDDVILLEVDSKQTQIDLSENTPQTHVSTLVTDEFGSRATTLVFNGISSATVKSTDGTNRVLTDFFVRATEYELPQSMPADLPAESAFTYCSELQIPGVRDDEVVTFDQPVVMYVDNFLNFNVGEIVPIGYYDRNDGEWKASDNGVVVKLLDTSGNGLVDGLDLNDDGIADDLNGNGETADEVVGIDNYQVGKTYWRGSFDHFTPWDFNWPYLPPTDAVAPSEVKAESSKEDKEDMECVATNSYVKPYPQAFHEDIPVTGTGLTLHYSSQRTAGYEHKINFQMSGDSIPSSMTQMIARLEIGGNVYEETFAPEANKKVEFIWDGKDPSGQRVEGAVRGTLNIGYKYQAEYSSAGAITTSAELSSFETAWAQLGSNTTGITGRDDFISWKSSFIDVQNTYDNQLAEGWSLSNHHTSSTIGSIYKGDGEIIDGDKASLVLKTGITESQHTGDDGFYQKGGSNIDYFINSNGVLEDRVTGLQWQYSFPRESFRSQLLASDYCSVISRDTGQAGWRLPTYKELVYTVDKSGGDHDFPIFQFEALNYWSDITFNTNQALIPLICVNGDRIDTSYIADLSRNDIDEVVVDGQNGLMWQDDISTTTHTSDWVSSIEYCEGLEHADYSDWRLPNINELTYVLPNTVFVNQTEIPDEPWNPTVSFRNPYWTSTPNYQNSDQAWAMESSSPSSYRFSKSDQNYVRCVRDNLQSVRSPYRFDENRKHIKTVDLDTGVTLTTFAYDENGRLSTMTDRFGDTVTINRDFTTGQVTSITSHDGYVTELSIGYDNNNLTQVSYPDGTYYQFIYDEKSLMTDEIKPNGYTFLHQFDENGRAVQTSDPEGGVWDFFSNRLLDGSVQYGYSTSESNTYQTVRTILDNYDVQKVTTDTTGTEFINVKQADDLKESSQSCSIETVVDSVIDSKTKEEIPSQITITLPSGLEHITEVTKTYAENGADTSKQTITMSINGKVGTVHSDSKTGISTVTSAEGRTFTSYADRETLLLQSTQTPELLDTAYTYDSRGRVTTVTTGDRTTTYYYDDAVSKGKVTSIIAADGLSTDYEYDSMGRVSKVTYPDGHSTQNSYDSQGNLKTLVIPTPATHSFAHNSNDNVTSETTPLNEQTEYSYDRDRRLTQIRLPSGDLISNTYSGGLLTRTATPEGNIDYTYECGAKVGSVTEGSESASYSYDGNLVTDISYSGVLDEVISQSYNNDFRVTALNYAGNASTFAYDDDGLIIEVNGYSIFRNLQNGLPEALNNGVFSQNRSYNGYGETENVSTTVNDEAVYDYTLSYNDIGQITAKQEVLDNGNVNEYDYTYDNKRQLVNVALNGMAVEQYSYDANGNRTTHSSTQRGISNQGSVYNVGDQLQSSGDTSYEYDADGQLSKKINTNGTTSYQYSSQGRLLQVETPSQMISYLHNAFGNRVAKRVDGVITEKYLWLNKTLLLATYDGSDNLKQRFEYADGHVPSSFVQDNQTYYIVTDHLGTPRAITDSTGVVVKRMTYDSFGNVLSDTNPTLTIPFGFAGGLQDVDTGFVRFGYRDYDPETGRWTARDPIGFAGGDSNLYGYVLNDPINFVDQDGLLPSLPQGLVDFAAGFGDAVSFGVTDWVRDKIDVNSSVDKCSGSYGAGAITGALASIPRGGGLKLAARRSCSFDGETEVLTIDGYKKIKDITEEDIVLSRNEVTGEHSFESVLAQYSNDYEETVYITIKDIESEQVQVITSNKIHPFFVKLSSERGEVPASSEGHDYQGIIEHGHWVDASDLKAGYLLLNDDKTFAEVVSVRIEGEALEAYNLTVDQTATFFIRGAGKGGAVWVHNCPIRPPAKRLGDVFGVGPEGAKDALNKLERGELNIPSDLTKADLLAYRELAINAISKQRERASKEPSRKRYEQSAKTDSVQGYRLKIINHLLIKSGLK